MEIARFTRIHVDERYNNQGSMIFPVLHLQFSHLYLKLHIIYLTEVCVIHTFLVQETLVTELPHLRADREKLLPGDTHSDINLEP